jgi:hypothetical protein
VLALIAVSLLGNRHRLDRIQNELSQSPHSVFLDKYPESFKSDLIKAKDLWVVGANLATTTNIYQDTFAAILSEGGVIRILIVDPRNTATALSAVRVHRGETEASVSATILLSLARMCRLRESYGGSIQLRTVNYVPSFGMFGLDLESQQAVFYLEHYGYKLKYDVPKFVIRPRDEKWFRLFRTQLFALWQDSTEWVHSEADTVKMIGGDAHGWGVSEKA